jgi:hypothetical protein
LSKHPGAPIYNGQNNRWWSLAMAGNERDAPLVRRPVSAEVAAFVEAARNTPVPVAGRGRLIFALDATMSRQPTWDLAQSLQARMFQAAADLGGLDVQLVYFRGFNECRASNFVSGGQGLRDLMTKIGVRGGATQIGKVLAHARNEARQAKVGALVFIGDAMEEPVERLLAIAGELAIAGVKAFMFQEGDDPVASQAFGDIARLTGGAYGAFDANAASRLEALLRAAAAYAAGGRAGLAAQAVNNEAARLLLRQMR